MLSILFKRYHVCYVIRVAFRTHKTVYDISVQVYASNKEKTIIASSICGPCEVLSMQNFEEEADRRTHLKDSSSGLYPVFMCR